jgi:hypothetical protein
MDVYTEFLQNYNLDEYIDFKTRYYNIRYYFDIYLDLAQTQNDYMITEQYNIIQNEFVNNNYLIKIIDTENCVLIYQYLFNKIHHSFREWLLYNDFDKTYELFEIFIKNQLEKYLNIIYDILSYKKTNTNLYNISRITEILEFNSNINYYSNNLIDLSDYDDIPTFLYLFKGCIFYMLEFNTYYKYDIGSQLYYMFCDYNSPDIIFDYNCEYLYNKFNTIKNNIIQLVNNEIIYYSSDSDNDSNSYFETEYDNINLDLDLDYMNVDINDINNSKEYFSQFLQININNCYICNNENLSCYICVNNHIFSCIECSTKIDKCPLCRYIPK